MGDPVFFRPAYSPSLSEIVTLTKCSVSDNADLSLRIGEVTPLDRSGPHSLVYFDNPKYAQDLEKTKALACFIQARFAHKLPAGTIALVTPQPYRAFALVSAKLFPQALSPGAVFGSATGISPSAVVHPDARLEEGVTVDPCAVIGPKAEIGAGTVVLAHAVIGADVRIGRGCSIGAHCSVTHAFIGNNVILHAGVRIGQDGFGFAMGPQGHLKVPQVGRVIIQDDVEIGANSCVDRGANRDTVIGEGTKIDNLVQIGHNVTIGRHAVIVSQVGIAGSTDIGDYVAIGGQAGIAGHLKIGMAAQIAACSGVMTDVPSGEKWGGAPARPMKQYMRAIALRDESVVTSRSIKQRSVTGDGA